MKQAQFVALLLALVLASATNTGLAQSGAAPSYARPAASGSETIHGSIVSLDASGNMQLDDDRGFVDSVRIDQKTLVTPSGTRLQPGMQVTIIGVNAGSVFVAHEVDAPPSYSVPTPPGETVPTPPDESVATPPDESAATPPGESVATPPGESVATPPRPAQRQPLCIISGSVEWYRYPQRPLAGVPLGGQGVTGPLKGARVTLIGKSSTQVTQTDVHGAFRFTAPVGSYTIAVQASGYAPERDKVTVTHFAGNICLGLGIALRPLSLAKQRANSSSSTSSPSSDPIPVAVQNAITAYCKNHPGLSCSLYQGDALKCETPAYNAVVIFPTVAMWKEEHGLSTTRAAQLIPAQSEDDVAIAIAAGEYLDRMHVTPRSYYSLDMQKMTATFATAVLRACLQNISQ